MRVGEEFRFAFSKPGEFVYYCPIHSICDMKLCTGMKGRVTVL
jgi:plastocyanin